MHSSFGNQHSPGSCTLGQWCAPGLSGRFGGTWKTEVLRQLCFFMRRPMQWGVLRKRRTGRAASGDKISPARFWSFAEFRNIYVRHRNLTSYLPIQTSCTKALYFPLFSAILMSGTAGKQRVLPASENDVFPYRARFRQERRLRERVVKCHAKEIFTFGKIYIGRQSCVHAAESLAVG